MKKTLRNALLIFLAMALVATASIFGTIAWLSDEDGAVNVMTLGNVYIEQNEYEYNENGELVDFTQGKPLLPYVGQLGWTNADYMDGAYRSFTMNNVVDKYVTVTNTGSTPAYVRTILALEMGEYDTVDEFYYKVVGVATNAANGAEFKFEGAWNWSDKFVAEIDGNNYLILVATHEDPVMPGEETIPSLLQVYMNKEADNEEVIKVDGNGNGMYDILAFSQAVQSTGFASAEEALNTGFGVISAADLTTLPWNASDYDLPVIVNTPAELSDALTEAGKANAGNTEIILAADLDLSDVDWTPINVDGYHGAGVITLDGGNNTITGLNAPLFAGGFAGKSGIVVKHLTIADSDIKSNSTLGAGAFIANADSMYVITLEDCHLVDSTIDSPESRNGGLIGWASGYANLNDGPVKTYITIEDCSVIDCEINGTSVGAIAGHPGASDYTYTTIKNCVAVGNTLTSTDDGEWRVGAIVGTANDGHVEIIDCTIGDNVMTQPNGGATTANTYPGDEVGRFVSGTTGTLVVTGTRVISIAESGAEFKDAAVNGGEIVVDGKIAVEDVTYFGDSAPVTVTGGTFSRDTASGNPLTVNTTEKVTFNGTIFESVKGSAVLATRKVGANIELNDCVFNNLAAPSTGNTGIQVFASNVTIVFNNCTFNNMPIETNTAYPDNITLVFNNCTFTWTGDNCPGMIKIANSVKADIDLNDCKFVYTTDSQYTSRKNMISIYANPGASTIDFNNFEVIGTRNNDNIWTICGNHKNLTITATGDLSYTFNGTEVDFNTYLK